MRSLEPFENNAISSTNLSSHSRPKIRRRKTAHGSHSTLENLPIFARETLTPTLIPFPSIERIVGKIRLFLETKSRICVHIKSPRPTCRSFYELINPSMKKIRRFVASTMKFFFERWPRINERNGKKKENDFIPGIILPRFDDYIRLHKAIPFSNADCSAVVSMQNAPSSYMVAILCCCTRLSLWDLKPWRSRFTFLLPKALTLLFRIR